MQFFRSLPRVINKAKELKIEDIRFGEKPIDDISIITSSRDEQT